MTPPVIQHIQFAEYARTLDDAQSQVRDRIDAWLDTVQAAYILTIVSTSQSQTKVYEPNNNSGFHPNNYECYATHTIFFTVVPLEEPPDD